MGRARIIIDAPRTGPANMALDEVLLASCAAGASPPTLRFYAWSPATISLGYFQEAAEVQRLDPPARDLGIVRRTTGGGAILHDLEVTYSIVLPVDHELVRGRPNALYRHVHQAIIDAVGGAARFAGGGGTACDGSARRGPFFCFDRRHDLDVVVGDSAQPGATLKLAGSAQRRTRGGILQHGSIMLDNRYRQHRVATWRLLGGPSNPAEAAERLIPFLMNRLGFEAAREGWRPAELRAAEPIERMYAGSAWTIDRARQTSSVGTG